MDGLRKFVNIFVDDDDVRYLDGLDTTVADGVTVSIIPAVAGGWRRCRIGDAIRRTANQNGRLFDSVTPGDPCCVSSLAGRVLALADCEC